MVTQCLYHYAEDNTYVNLEYMQLVAREGENNRALAWDENIRAINEVHDGGKQEQTLGVRKTT